jgi:hypothetical protein
MQQPLVILMTKMLKRKSEIEQRKIMKFESTVKPVYNDHSWDPQKVVVVQRWSLFGGCSENWALLKFYFLEKQLKLISRAKLSFKQLSFATFFN